MSTQAPSDPAPVIWFEIRTTDTTAAKGFYEQLFGWRFEAMADYDDDYWVIEPSPGQIGGVLLSSADAEGGRRNVLRRAGRCSTSR